jgi:hypothetical protein
VFKEIIKKNLFAPWRKINVFLGVPPEKIREYFSREFFSVKYYPENFTPGSFKKFKATYASKRKYVWFVLAQFLIFITLYYGQWASQNIMQLAHLMFSVLDTNDWPCPMTNLRSDRNFWV